MTDRVEPLTAEEIAKRRAVPEDYAAIGLSRGTYFRLLDIAEDHARLVEERGRIHEIVKFYAEDDGTGLVGKVQECRDCNEEANTERIRLSDQLAADAQRIGKLEAVERAARKAWGMAAFPDVNYGLSDALAACDEEEGS